MSGGVTVTGERANLIASLDTDLGRTPLCIFFKQSGKQLMAYCDFRSMTCACDFKRQLVL